MNEPKAKKIKLSLEPSINNKVSDINNAGQQFYKTESTLPEKFMETAGRIWNERGEWKDITEESLLAAIESPMEVDDEQKQKSEEGEQNAAAVIRPPCDYDIFRLRDHVVNKLIHAKGEIDVALDIINILAAGNRSTSSSNAAKANLVLPVGSLTATYVTKPKPTQKAQLELVQLNLGLKRTKQKAASDFLKKSAASLKNLVEKEQVFWDEALDLRRNNWMIQSGSTNAGSSFFINYGFSEVGSDFNEQSMGELKRSADHSKELQLALPHGSSKRLAVKINQSHTAGLVGGQKAFSEGILGISSSNTEEQQDTDIVYSTAKTTTTITSDIQNQLAEAHSTVYDAELFSDILGEAQALNSNVRFPDDEIVINIDGQIDLSIKKVSPSVAATASTAQQSSINTTKEIISRTIDLSFRLLLLQHQRYNLWKMRAKILSSNHKIHQLLQEASPFITNTTTAAPGPATPNMINNNNNPNIPNSNQTGNTMIGSNNQIMPNAQPSAASVGNATVTGQAAAALAVAAQQQQPQQQRGARTKNAPSTLNQLTITQQLPKEIPILLPIMSFSRFWVQFDRIRHVVHKLTKPFTSSGLSTSVHFLLSSYSPCSVGQYEKYPGYSEISLSLGISLLKGPSLHFGLNQSGSVSVNLPQTTVNLQNVSEFEAFLSREIKVICLRTVCDVANGLIQRNENYLNATDGSDKQRWLWKVDQVDEAIHGSIYWKKSCWRNINVSLDGNALLFRLGQAKDIKENVYQLNLNAGESTAAATEALNFKERACVIIKNIMNDAIMTN